MSWLLLGVLTVALGLFTNIECAQPKVDLPMEEFSCDQLVASPVNFNLTGRGLRILGGNFTSLELHNDVQGEDTFNYAAKEFAVQADAFSAKCPRDLNCKNGFTITAWTKLAPRRYCKSACNTILGHTGPFGQSLGISTALPHFFHFYYTANTTDWLVRTSCSMSHMSNVAERLEGWTHWAVTGDGQFGDSNTLYTLYMNGTSLPYCTRVNEAKNSIVTATDRNMHIGCTQVLETDQDCTCGFHGEIGRIRMYKKDISESKIVDQYEEDLDSMDA